MGDSEEADILISGQLIRVSPPSEVFRLFFWLGGLGCVGGGSLCVC